MARLAGDKENTVPLTPSVRGITRLWPETREWAGVTPCCESSVHQDLLGVKCRDAYWYYKKCPSCGCMVEIMCLLRKRGIAVTVGITRANALWGAGAGRQRVAVDKAISRGRQSTISEVEIKQMLRQLEIENGE